MTTIQEALKIILQAVPDEGLEHTVDTVKAGDPSQELRGIATTFLATGAVIQQATRLGVNLLITHEPVFYNHEDQTDWLEGDPVYLAKRRWIEQGRVVIWRFHDHWHMHQPDGIYTGMLKELGWEAFADPYDLSFINLPPRSLAELVGELKVKLAIPQVRIVGDPQMSCEKIVLSVGAPGGQVEIRALSQTGADVIVCGEINEWETSEYVRDAIQSGRRQALVVLGHVFSEESGMKYLVDWLKPKFPGVPVTHLPAGSPFSFV